MWLKYSNKWIGSLVVLNLFSFLIVLFGIFFLSLKAMFWGLDWYPVDFFEKGAHPYSFLELGEKYHGGPIYQLWLDELSKPREKVSNRFEISEGGYFSEELDPYLGARFSERELEKYYNRLLEIASNSRNKEEMEARVEEFLSKELKGDELEEQYSRFGGLDVKSLFFQGEKEENWSLEDYLKLRKLWELRARFLWKLRLEGGESYLPVWRIGMEDGFYQVMDKLRHNMNLFFYLPWSAAIRKGLDDPLESFRFFEAYEVWLKERDGHIDSEFPAYRKAMFNQNPNYDAYYHLYFRALTTPYPFWEHYRRSWIDPLAFRVSSPKEPLENYLTKVRIRALDYFLERGERKYFYRLNRVVPDLFHFDMKEKTRFGRLISIRYRSLKQKRLGKRSNQRENPRKPITTRLTWLRRLKRYRMNEILYDYVSRYRERRGLTNWRYSWARDRFGKVKKDHAGKPIVKVEKYAETLSSNEQPKSWIVINGTFKAWSDFEIVDGKGHLDELRNVLPKLWKGKNLYLSPFLERRLFRNSVIADWLLSQELELLNQGYDSSAPYGPLSPYQRFYFAMAHKHRHLSGREVFFRYPKAWVNYLNPFGQTTYFLKEGSSPFSWHLDPVTKRLRRVQFDLSSFKKDYKKGLFLINPSWIPKGVISRLSFGEPLRRKRIASILKENTKSFFTKQFAFSSWKENWKKYGWVTSPVTSSFQTRLRLAQMFRHLEDWSVGDSLGSPEERKTLSGRGWPTHLMIPGWLDWSWSWYFSYLWNGFWLESQLKTYLTVLTVPLFYFLSSFFSFFLFSFFFWFVWFLIWFFLGLALFWLIRCGKGLETEERSTLFSLNEKEFDFLFFKTFYRWKDSVTWFDLQRNWSQTNWYLVDRSYYSLYGRSFFHFGKGLGKRDITLGMIRLLFFFWVSIFLLGICSCFFVSSFLLSP